MVRNPCEVSRAVNMVSTPRHRCQHFTNLSTNTVITPDKVSTHTHRGQAVKTLAKSPLKLQWLRMWRDLDYSLESIIWSAYSGWWQLAAVHLNWFHTAHQLVIVGLKFDNGEPGYYIRNRLDSTLNFWSTPLASGFKALTRDCINAEFFSRQSGLEFPGSWEIIV